MAYQLNAAQKEEIRRLNQLANRRIITIQNTYAKAGRDITPAELVGKGHQTVDQWETPTKPLSRSTVFNSEREYNERIKYYRSFEGKNARPTLTEYTKVQRHKVELAISTSLDGATAESVLDRITKKLNKLSAPQLAAFWEMYSEKAAKMGLQYGSDAAMLDTISEFFGEDYEDLVGE